MIKKITSSFLLILFPSYCYLCRKEGVSLCKECLHGRVKAYESPAPYITSIYSFKDPSIKKIIHAIKYFHRKDLVFPIVETIVNEIITKEGFSCLVPIPMPQWRKYIRGYNHAEVIAREIANQTNLPIRTDILKRRSSKKRQVMTTSRHERLKNQHNTFNLTSSVVGMRIILIDDVTTTGATLREARKKLLEGGAIVVEAYTIAH